MFRMSAVTDDDRLDKEAAKQVLRRTATMARPFRRTVAGALLFTALSTVGLVVGSIAFGAGHLVQGYDAAITTGLLGLFWGFVYLRRRSVVAPMVSHSGFNLFQMLQYLAFVSR